MRSVIWACALGASLPAFAYAQAGVPAPPDSPSPTPTAEPEPEPVTAPAPAPAPAAVDPDLEASLAADAASSPVAGVPSGAGGGLNVQSMLPDIAVITDVAFGWFSVDAPRQDGGHDPRENGFTLQQVELSLGKSVDPYFRFDANIVFSQFGVEVEEAYATTLALPARLQLRGGQFLTRFGRINATHPHTWDFVDQAFAVSRVFGGEGNRGLGVELSWLAPLPWSVELLASVTDARGEATARSFFGGANLPLETPLDLQATLAAKQFFELGPDLSLLLGLSWAGGPNATGHDNRTEIYGADLYLKYRPISFPSETIVTLTAEIFHRRRQVPGDVLVDTSGYAALAWRFATRWATAVRWEFGTAATDTDAAVPDELDPQWTGLRQRTSANLTFWPTEFSRLRLQGSLDHVAWEDDPVLGAMLTAEWVIGAHGAHKF